MIIIVNSKVSGTNIQGALGKPEYSYYFLLRQFLPALEQIAQVISVESIDEVYRPLMHRFLSSVDRIVTASPNYLATSDVLAHYKHKTDVIPYGLNKTAYDDIDPERLAYWRQQFPDGFFLFVGVMRYYKGLHILLDACKDTDYPVVIVGAGPLENTLRQQAQRLRLHNVYFLGPPAGSGKERPASTVTGGGISVPPAIGSVRHLAAGRRHVRQADDLE